MSDANAKDEQRFRLTTLIHLHLNVPATTHAQMSIPPGTVGRMRATFESRIARHHHERDIVLISRALRNTVALHPLNRTYEEQLRIAENFTLRTMPTRLLAFVRDHDNLHHALVRSRQQFRNVMFSRGADALVWVAQRIKNLRIEYNVTFICKAGLSPGRQRMIRDRAIDHAMSEVTDTVMAEMFDILRRLTHIAEELFAEDDEFENVGPDHDVDDFGTTLVYEEDMLPTVDAAMQSMTLTVTIHTAVPVKELQDLKVYNSPDPCPICLLPYTSTAAAIPLSSTAAATAATTSTHSHFHTPFKLSACGHIVGKNCLSTWLNSTAVNATSCPMCRALLCERRSRRPQHSPLAAEHTALVRRISWALELLEDIDFLWREVSVEMAATDVRRPQYRGEWYDVTIENLNRWLYEARVGYGFVRQEDAMPGMWGLVRLYFE